MISVSLFIIFFSFNIIFKSKILDFGSNEETYLQFSCLLKEGFYLLIKNKFIFFVKIINLINSSRFINEISLHTYHSNHIF